MKVSPTSKFVAEMLGTMVLVLMGCGSAVIAGGKALSQIWLFIVAPIVGAALAAIVYNALIEKPEKAA